MYEYFLRGTINTRRQALDINFRHLNIDIISMIERPRACGLRKSATYYRRSGFTYACAITHSSGGIQPHEIGSFVAVMVGFFSRTLILTAPIWRLESPVNLVWVGVFLFIFFYFLQAYNYTRASRCKSPPPIPLLIPLPSALFRLVNLVSIIHVASSASSRLSSTFISHLMSASFHPVTRSHHCRDSILFLMTNCTISQKL